MNEKKTEHITICLTKSDKRKADNLAEKAQRKTGQFISIVVSDYLKGKHNK